MCNDKAPKSKVYVGRKVFVGESYIIIYIEKTSFHQCLMASGKNQQHSHRRLREMEDSLDSLRGGRVQEEGDVGVFRGF